MDNNLPEGLTFDPPAGSSPLPPGLSFDQPQPSAAQAQLPPDLTFDNPAQPDKSTPPQVSNTEVPGFWSTVGSAFGRGVVQEAGNELAGARVALPEGWGGKSLEQQYQEGSVAPETKDTIDNLLGQTVSQGWNDPKWWGAQIASGAGGIVPGIAEAFGGELVGLPPPATFAASAAVGKLVPAYKAARAAGLDPDAATKRAIVDSGISAATAAVMGLTAGKALYGTKANEAVQNQVSEVLKRPVLEAITQIGLVQPAIGVGGHEIEALTHGKSLDADQALTDWLTNMGVGAGMAGTAAGVRLMDRARQAAQGLGAPAKPGTVDEAFKNQKPDEILEPEEHPLRDAAQDVTQNAVGAQEAPDQQEGLLEGGLELKKEERGPIFYSAVQKAVQDKLPDVASAEQVMATIRNAAGVKEEEINNLQLPQWLADQNGKVSKADLLAHIEDNQVQLQEVIHQEPPAVAQASAARQSLIDQYGSVAQAPEAERNRWMVLQQEANRQLAGDEFTLPKYPTHGMLPGHFNAREFLLNLPQRGEKRPPLDLGHGEVAQNVDPTKDFVTEHWPDVVNNVGHVLTSDYVDRDGMHMLHIREMQSDVHQQGREKGYVDDKVPSFSDAQKALREANARYDEFLRDHGQRKGETSVDAKARLERMPEYQKLVEERKGLWNNYQAALGNEGKVPNLPFKTTWPELLIKRMMRYAADQGYDGVSFANGEQVGLRQATEKQYSGSREFYDKIVPSIVKKWAKKLGADVAYTSAVPEGYNPLDHVPEFMALSTHQRYRAMKIDPANLNTRNLYVKLNPAFMSRVQYGLPLYDKDLSGRGGKTLSDIMPPGAGNKLMPAAKKIDQIIRKAGNELKLTRGISFNVAKMDTPWRGRLRPQVDPTTGNYVIDVNLNRIATKEDLYAAMSHEFGHVVMHNLFETAPESEKLAIKQAFGQFRNSLPPGDISVGDVRRLRDNAISEMSGARNQHNDYRLSELQPRSRAYLLSFEEWFAEQTSKWMQTNERPMGIVQKFFKSLGQKIRKVIETFQRLRGIPATPETVVGDWLNSHFDRQGGWIEPILEQLDIDTTRANAAAMDRDGTPETPATPQTASTIGGRNILRQLPPDGRAAGAASAAHADRMNRFYEWMTSLPQIAEMNKHIRPLQLYKEVVALMNLEKNNIMSAAEDTRSQWSKLNGKEMFNLSKFIEDYALGRFKLPHTMDGLIRRPNQEEFRALVAKHNLSDAATRVFGRVTKDFDGFLEQYRKLLLEDAARIKDAARKAQAVQDVNTLVDGMLKRPFMPLMRFGKYTITVYDSNGNIKHNEQTNSLRRQAQIAEALKKSSDLLPGDRIRTGQVAKEATPLLGMPPGLLDLIDKKLNFSDAQRAALDQLRFQYAPSQSFRHNFHDQDTTPGYSTDFMRAYANFFFHGANHITRVKWVDALRDQVKAVRNEAIGRDSGNKIDHIANYMTEHLKLLVDPKPDFAALRGLMFHWFLGFNPASATLNLTQTPIMTFPHLASKFGDISALTALYRAGTDLNTLYKKATIKAAAESTPAGPAGAKMRALAEAIKEGVLSETQAHTLAAVAEDRNLLKVFGSKKEENWQKFSAASSWMFEMTEQYNRRIAFRAAWDLGMRNPNSKYVQETVRDNPLQYKRLRDQGWSHQEAAAFTAAKDSVEKTQFVYAPYARPKFMWGKKGALFVFKSFTQNTLFNLWNNPSMAARSLLILGAAGGLMGLPGMEDVNGILKALAWKLFGKDFDLEDQTREFATDTLNGAINPDLLLHGSSTYGFGIPHVMNAVGGMVGLEKWFPTLDRSRSIGMGNILPFEPGKLFGPTRDIKGQELGQLQRSFGAAYGNAFALYNFVNSEQSLSDLKRWELVMPKAMSNMSHAWRFFYNGAETNKAGNAIVRFDVHDTEQMAEVLARAAGYQPRRLTQAWDEISAKADAATYWDLRRGILLRQFGEAVKTQSPEDKSRVLEAVRRYNKEVPDEIASERITAKALKDSVVNRLRVQQKQEANLPLEKRHIQLYRSMDKYFPEGRPTGQIGAKPVR